MPRGQLREMRTRHLPSPASLQCPYGAMAAQHTSIWSSSAALIRSSKLCAMSAPTSASKINSDLACPKSYDGVILPSAFAGANDVAGPSKRPTPFDPSGDNHNAENSPNSSSKQQKSRTARACSSCNRQKLRCSGDKPCARCVSLKIEDDCEYLPSLRGKTRKRRDKDDGNKRRREDGDSSSSPDARPPGGPHQLLPHEMDNNMAMWKRDASISHHGPAISTLWGLDPPPKNPITLPPQPPSSYGSPMRPPSGIIPHTNNVHNRSQLEKLTTLPLPGDSHNPLAVLAEASATAKSDNGVNSPEESNKARDPEEAYYAPLERSFKDEAPHIMSFIKVHE